MDNNPEVNLQNISEPQLPPKNTKRRNIFLVSLLAIFLLSCIYLIATKSNTKQNTTKSTITSVDDKEDYFGKQKTTATVVIEKQGITPQTILVKPYTAIVFENHDTINHKLAVTQGSIAPKYFESETITPGSGYTAVYVEKGTYRLFDVTNPTWNIQVEVSAN